MASTIRFTMWTWRRLLLSLMLVVSPLVAVTFPSSGQAVVRVGDGPAPCSAGMPPQPLHGFCATYGGANTYYGTYGPGFPTAFGWGLCAWAPATGGWYPSTTYDYVVSDPPNGADTSQLGALGFAFSQASLNGFFQGGPNWSADDAAVAAKLYYDVLAWHLPWPTMSAGVEAARNLLYVLVAPTQSAGGRPDLTLTLPGGARSFTTHTTVTARLAYPATGVAFANQTVSFSASNATFDATHSSSVTATTNSAGEVVLPLTASTSQATTVTVTARTQLGELGISFDRASQAYAANAQDIASPLGTSLLTRSGSWTSLAPPPVTGKLALLKTGNDQPYLGVAGAQFEIRSGASVLDSLTTDENGAAGPTPALTVGTYTLHEVTAPPGYTLLADQNVTVVGNTTTVISLTGAQAEQAIPGSLSLEKVDDHSGAPLAGAVLALAYDARHTGTYVDIGTCTTDGSGTCSPPGTDGASWLPGYYRVSEQSAPPGYLVNPTTQTQFVELAPGQLATVRFADDRILTTLFVAKSNALEPTQGVPDATYDLYVNGTPPLSTPATGPLLAGVHTHASWYAQGITDASGHLGFTIPVGYSWCIQERSAPRDFIVDPALRCTGVINQGAPDPVRTVAVSERVATVSLNAYKFNTESPNTVIPDASYALFVEGTFPQGFLPPSRPAWLSVPPGMTLWALDTTNSNGQLQFTLPSGHQWCLKETLVPSGYLLDRGLHCSGILTSSSTSSASLALPELAATGGPERELLAVALVCVSAGILSATPSMKRRQRTTSGTTRP